MNCVVCEFYLIFFKINLPNKNKNPLTPLRLRPFQLLYILLPLLIRESCNGGLHVFTPPSSFPIYILVPRMWLLLVPELKSPSLNPEAFYDPEHSWFSSPSSPFILSFHLSLGKPFLNIDVFCDFFQNPSWVLLSMSMSSVTASNSDIH